MKVSVRKVPISGKKKSHWSPAFDEIKSLSVADHNYRNPIYTLYKGGRSKMPTKLS